MSDDPLDLIREGQRQGRIPNWVGRERPPAGSRESIREDFKGTQNIAGAAERLVEEGSIFYDQATPEDISKTIEGVAERADQSTAAVGREWKHSFMDMAPPDDMLQVTRGNCYDFVHFAAWLARKEGGRLHLGNNIQDAIDPETLEEWDGESDIPRGKVIIGCVPRVGISFIPFLDNVFGAQTSDNTYHFGVSLGDGEVANNRGSGVKRERLEDEFGGWSLYSLPGGHVYYGDYACYAHKEPLYEEDAVTAAPPEEPSTPLPPAPMAPNPRSARQQRRIRAAGCGCGLTGLAIILAFVGLNFMPGLAFALPPGPLALTATSTPMPTPTPSVTPTIAETSTPTATATDTPIPAPTLDPSASGQSFSDPIGDSQVMDDAGNFPGISLPHDRSDINEVRAMWITEDDQGFLIFWIFREKTERSDSSAIQVFLTIGEDTLIRFLVWQDHEGEVTQHVFGEEDEITDSGVTFEVLNNGGQVHIKIPAEQVGEADSFIVQSFDRVNREDDRGFDNTEYYPIPIP